VLFNFSFDQISAYLSNKPVASGSILKFADKTNRSALLLVTNGNIHEGQLIHSGKLTGIISRVYTQNFKSPKEIWVDINGVKESDATSSFKVFSTLRIANIALIVELILIFLLFYFVFKAVSPWNKLAITALLLSSIWWLFRNILFQKIHSYGAVFIGGTTILIMVFSLAFYYYHLSNPKTLFVYFSPSFWMVSAILLYKAGTFFLFLYVNTLNQTEKANFYIINSGFYFFENILFSVPFLIKEKSLLNKT
jgi:hypothetical protein